MTTEPDRAPADAGAPLTLGALKAMYPPVKGRSADIPAALWDEYLYAAAEVADREALRDMVEAEIREQAGDAQVLTVDGAKVAVRVTQEVRNASWVKDFYRRLPRRNTP